MAGAPWVDPPTHIKIDGHTITVCTPDTVTLVRAFLIPEASGLHTIFAFVDNAGRRHLLQRITEPLSPLTLEFFEFAADDLVHAALGSDRWTITRLWERSIGAWRTIDGELLAAGVDVTVLPPARATHAVYGVWRRLHQRAPDEWQKWLSELERPPARVVRRTIAAATADDNLTDFQQLQALQALAGSGSDRSSQIVMPNPLS